MKKYHELRFIIGTNNNFTNNCSFNSSLIYDRHTKIFVDSVNYDYGLFVDKSHKTRRIFHSKC